MTEQRPDWTAEPGKDGLDEDASMDVQAIEAEIEGTRTEMTETVDAIGAKLDPGNIVEGAKETVRAATVGKVEDMANTAGQMVEEVGTTAQQTGAGIFETIKRNPVPAAMVGIGIGLLWMNRAESGSMHSWSGDTWSRSGTAGYAGYGRSGFAGYGYGPGSEFDRGGASGHESGSMGGRAGVGERVGEFAGEAAGTARGVADEAASTVQRTAQDVGRTTGQIAWRAERAVEDNPLAVGALALAAGAVIGMALPSTRMEERTLGQAGQRLLEGAQTAVERPLQEVEDKARSA